MVDSRTPSSDDQSLLARIREGDEHAFEQLFLAYYHRLWAFAYDLTHSDAVAEDIVQDVLTSLWVRRKSLDATQHLVAYLFGAVRNKVYQHHRHRGVVTRSEEAADAIVESGMGAPPVQPDVELGEQELLATIEKAIAQMPPGRREAIILRWREQLSYQEIANVMGITPNAVSAQVTRARRELHEILESSSRM